VKWGFGRRLEYILEGALKLFSSDMWACVNFGRYWPNQPRMAVGQCHHGLRPNWHRPDADTGDVHCIKRRRRGWWRRGESATNGGRLGGLTINILSVLFY